MTALMAEIQAASWAARIPHAREMVMPSLGAMATKSEPGGNPIIAWIASVRRGRSAP